MEANTFVYPQGVRSGKAVEQVIEGYQGTIIESEGGPSYVAEKISEFLDQQSQTAVFLPIHNIYGGNVIDSLSALAKLSSSVQISQIVKQEIKHRLVGLPGQNPDGGIIKSHIQALTQCSEGIKKYGLAQKVAIESTQTGVDDIQLGEFFILDEYTAREKNLEIYDNEDFGPNENYTYFAVVEKKGTPTSKKSQQLIDVGVMNVENTKGSLFLQILPLVLGGTNMKQITSALDMETNSANIGVVIDGNLLEKTNRVLQSVQSNDSKDSKRYQDFFYQGVKKILQKDVHAQYSIDKNNVEKIELDDTSGSLLKLLAVAYLKEINLTSLESKVLVEKGNRVVFTLSAQGDASMEKLAEKINTIKEEDILKILGFVAERYTDILGLTSLSGETKKAA